MRRRKKRQTGVALILVLAVIVMSSILGISYLSMTTVRLAGSTNLLRASRSRYLAESGLNHALYLLRANDPGVFAATVDSPMGPYHADGGDDTYTFYPSAVGVLEYEIVSNGTSLGITRTSRMRVRLSSDYAEKVLALDPLHWWRMGELAGTTAQDLGERHEDGTYNNGVQLGQPGVLGGDTDRSAGFDGWNDYVNLGTTREVKGHHLTFLVWFKADDFGVSNARLVSKAHGTWSNQHLWMLSTVESGGAMRLQFFLKTKDGLGHLLIGTGGTIEPGEWTLAAATYDGHWMRLYQNGTKVGERIKTGDVDDKDFGLEVNAWIGNNPDDDTSRPFDGLIDEVVIYKKTLTVDQIEDLYDARMATVEVLSWDE